MGGRRKSRLVLLLPLLMVGGVSADILFEDGFEISGPNQAFDRWTGANGRWQLISSDAAAFEGDWGADFSGISGGPDGTLLLEISTVGFHGLILEFAEQVRGALEIDDVMRVEWTPDSKDWKPLAFYTNMNESDWILESLALPPEASDNPNFAFRLIGDFSSAGDRMGFDSFVLRGTPIPEPGTLSLLGASVAVLRRRDWFRRGRDFWNKIIKTLN